MRPEPDDSAAVVEPETRDPMSDELLAARKATFDVGEGWCHEGKRGWRCKVNRMVESGWTFDPSPETEDGVTCFYCNLSLDGWEPKDDPFEEHKRRGPECPFFTLVEQYHGVTGAKGKAGNKSRGRASSASKGSRMSTQSAMTDVSALDSLSGDLGDSGTAVDDSIMSTASQATTKGKKKPGRKPAAKKGKGKKQAGTAEDESALEAQHPDLSQSQQDQDADSIAVIPAGQPAAPERATRKGTRQSKQPESSLLEVSQSDAAPKKHGQKPKAQPQPAAEVERRQSEVSIQLQDELEHSIEQDFPEPDHESTPHQMPATQTKRGTKRTSEGLKKEQDSFVLGTEFPAPPKPATKSKRGRKPSKQLAASQEVETLPEVAQSAEPIDASVIEYPWMDSQTDQSDAEPTNKKAAPKAKRAQAKKSKSKKTSSTRSSRATGTDAEPNEQGPEDLARDEAEIEAELARIAAEQQATIAQDQGNPNEYEPSPSHADKHATRIHNLEASLQHITDALPDPSRGMQDYIATVNEDLLPASPEPAPTRPPVSQDGSPSPSGSDKENLPSSHNPLTALKPTQPVLSPTKTSRIPLAPGTPTRSPNKSHGPFFFSPSKNHHPLNYLTTTHPWHPLAPEALDAIFLASPLGSPGTLGGKLAAAASAASAGGGGGGSGAGGREVGGLSSFERGLSVEEWVRWRGEVGEAEVRRRCEVVVAGFEREGGRALECLAGVNVG